MATPLALLHPPCSPRSPGYSNALYALQPDKMLWTQPSVFCAEGSAAPVARLGASATALHAHAALLLFGAQVPNNNPNNNPNANPNANPNPNPNPNP